MFRENIEMENVACQLGSLGRVKDRQKSVTLFIYNSFELTIFCLFLVPIIILFV